jgi:hypothetical protein
MTDTPDNSTSFDLIVTSWLTLVLAVIFLFQELRQFIDQPSDYINSTTNLMDLLIFTNVSYISIAGGLCNQPIPVLLMALNFILQGTRLLLHVRILPSVGPIIRITFLSISDIAPIFIPMGIMLLFFAGGFYLLHQDMIPGTLWTSFLIALQHCLSFITFDYSYNIINPVTLRLKMLSPCLL